MGRLIGVLGGIKSGKDETTNIIRYILTEKAKGNKVSYEGYLNHNKEYLIENIKFAESLKEMVAHILSVDRVLLEDREFKDTIIPWLTMYKLTNTITNEIEYIAKDLYKQKDRVVFEDILVTPRWLMINIANRAFRNNICRDWWVMNTFKSYSVVDSNWVISDVRFENEIEMIEKYGGKIIHVFRPFADRYPEYKDLPLLANETIYSVPKSLESVDNQLYTTLTNESETISMDITLDYLRVTNNGDIDLLYHNLEFILENDLLY